MVQLEPSVAFLYDERIVEPGVARFVTDQVEALSELDRRADAEKLLDWYEGNARRLERISALANCARCRGLLAARAGDLDVALADYEEALGWHSKVVLPLDRARTLLVLGGTQRRIKRRREARETLEEALGVFERIGAALWADARSCRARAHQRTRGHSGRSHACGGAVANSWPKARRTARSPQRSSSPTARSRATSRACSASSASGIARKWGRLWPRVQTQGIAVPNTGESPVSAPPSAP